MCPRDGLDILLRVEIGIEEQDRVGRRKIDPWAEAEGIRRGSKSKDWGRTDAACPRREEVAKHLRSRGVKLVNSYERQVSH